jgi:hypothetical protein
VADVPFDSSLAWTLLLEAYVATRPAKRVRHIAKPAKLFYAWKAFTAHRRREKAAAIACSQLASMRVTSTFLRAWYNVTLGRVHNQRRLLTKAFSAWSTHAKAGTVRKAERLQAASHYQTRLLSRIFDAWAERTRAHEGGRALRLQADAYFAASARARTVRRWKDWAKRVQVARLTEEAAAAWSSRTLLNKVFASWKAWTRKQVLRTQANAALRETVLRETFKTWYTHAMQVRSERMARQSAEFSAKAVIFQAWKEFVRERALPRKAALGFVARRDVDTRKAIFLLWKKKTILRRREKWSVRLSLAW